MKNRFNAFLIMLMIAFVFVLVSCPAPESNVPGGHSDVDSPSAGVTNRENIALGMPVFTNGAKYEGHNFIVKTDSLVSGYNDITHNPNWVSWYFGPSFGRSIRGFATEELLPADMRTVHEDYSACAPKYNRGHMCPNGDRKSFPGNGTYTMVNIIPQDGKVNGGIYARYENDMRNLARQKGMEYFSVSGPSLESDGKFVGPGSGLTIEIPSFSWRITFLINEEGGDDLERINSGAVTDMEVHSIWMPNDIADISYKNWQDYEVSIDFIEEKTGLDIFPLLEEMIEKKIESVHSGSLAEKRYR